jgi:hypothetical protein
MQALRMVAIIVCALLLGAPTLAYRPWTRSLSFAEVISVLFPVWLCLLILLCIAEGRAREQQAQRERRRDP